MTPPDATDIAAEILTEFHRARALYGPFRCPHEGYAVILEELDELWDAVKANDPERAREEAIQVGAMALAFALEVPLREIVAPRYPPNKLLADLPRGPVHSSKKSKETPDVLRNVQLRETPDV